MGIDFARIRIVPTPRRADDEYIAHARIVTPDAGGYETDIYVSGDLAGFESREDAITFAEMRAREWIASSYRFCLVSKSRISSANPNTVVAQYLALNDTIAAFDTNFKTRLVR